MNPEVNDLHCTITLEIMSNPVKLGCDHNFGKAALSAWFANGKNTCPLDQSIVDENLITYNDELRTKIENYVNEHPECLEEGQLRPACKDLSKIKAALIRSHELIATQAQEAVEREEQAQAIGRLNEVLVQRVVLRNDILVQREEEIDQRCGRYALYFAIFFIGLLILHSVDRD